MQRTMLVPCEGLEKMLEGWVASEEESVQANDSEPSW